MLDKLLSFIAPHHCCSCDEIGTLLCASCKNDIANEPFERCVACGKGLVFAGKVCNKCHVLYTRAWCAGVHEKGLEVLIDKFKFKSARAAADDLVDLIDAVLPNLPENVTVVPIPTIDKHIRQRGFDHTELMVKKLAWRRGLKISRVLKRATSSRQIGANRKTRVDQAKRAFRCNEQLKDDVIYLILDDVITTGSTVKYAARTLKDAGAGDVWVVAVARHGK